MTRHYFALFAASCGSFLLAAFTACIVQLLRWATSQASVAKGQALGTLAGRAITYTAEVAATKLKEGTVLTPLQKLDTAVAFMLRNGGSLLTMETATDALHAALPQSGEGAAQTIFTGSAILPSGFTSTETGSGPV